MGSPEGTNPVSRRPSSSRMRRKSLALASLAVALYCILHQPPTTCQSAASGSVRVLLVRDSARQQAIEEAASLSLDLPRQAPEGNSSSSGESETGTQSLGYQQVSLASLTLHQRRQSEPTNANTTTRASHDRRRLGRDHQAKQPDPWSELQLTRHRPSWLNVSDRFKITGSSIEELEVMMPTEYLLRQAFDSPVLLKTKLGILEGVRSVKFNKHLYTFLSVPYAKPPVDTLRFKAPQPIDKWEGILQATKWPPFCVQPSMTLATKTSPVHILTQVMSEDCLYLNIWSPSLKFNRNQRRPVMVWLHGGAFQYGGISVDENDGSALALAGDLVVVTLSYRVSAFGFLNANNPINGPNNVGLLDQRLAMEWVQQNIKQFGGDPQQVVLFGESAGSHSVGLHMISPASQALFKRAIMQSGVPNSFLRSYDVNSDNKGSTVGEGIGSIMIAKRLKCYADDVDESSPTTTIETPTPTTATGEPERESGAEDENEASTSSSSSSPDLDQADQVFLSDAALECMRQKPSLEVLKAMGVPGNAGFFPTGNDPKGFFPNGPIMESFDGENLKVGPQKDYLIGTNTDEGTFMLHYGMPSLFPARESPKVNSIESLKTMLAKEIERMGKSAIEQAAHREGSNQTKIDIQSASGSQDGGAHAHLYKPLLRTSNSILESFMPKSQVRVLANGTITGNTSRYDAEAEFGKAVGSLITDIIFLCPSRQLARTLSGAGRNVYFYLYDYRSSLSQWHEWIGVTHHDEVEFVFGRPLRLADVYSGRDVEMSQRLIKIWSHFAYTGQMLELNSVKWPKYGEEDNNYMVLSPSGASVGQRYHDRVCNVYDTVISVHLQDH